MSSVPDMQKRDYSAMGLFPWIAPLLIAAAVWLAYSNSLNGAFVFDDDVIVTDPTIRSLWPPWEVLSPPRQVNNMLWRPFVQLTLAVNYAIGGTDVYGYHVFNLGIHIINALLLFGIGRRTLLLTQRGNEKSAAMPALLVALLWGVHPLTTAAVTYVSQRTESLMALFYLLTLYCAIRSFASERTARWQSLSVAACFLGMTCKEVMVSAPVMVLLYDRLFVSGSLKESLARKKYFYLGLFASWLLLLALLAGARVHGSRVGFGEDIKWWKYSLTQIVALVMYGKLSFWPAPLIFDYGYAVIRDTGLIVRCGLIVGAVLASWLFAFKRGSKLAGYLGLLFFVLLAPTSIIPCPIQVMGEHRMYLPLAVILSLLVAGAYAGGRRLLAWRVLEGSRFPGLLRIAGIGAACALALTLGIRTHLRNMDYSSEISLWTDTVKKAPENPRAHNNLAKALEREGRTREANVHLREAVRLSPSREVPWFNLGNNLARSGDLPEAARHFRKALELSPEYVKARMNLANVLLMMGDVSGAIIQYRMAVRDEPDLADAWANLGFALIRTGDYMEARQSLSRALALDPENRTARRCLREPGISPDQIRKTSPP